VFNDSPEWGIAIVLCPWLAYRHYGDRQILEDNFDAMAAYLRYLGSRAANGIIDYGLGDWYDIGEGAPGFAKLTKRSLTGTAIYAHGLAVMSYISRLLERADLFNSEAKKVREMFHVEHFDRAHGWYDRGSQTAQAMPLALGLCPPAYRESVLAKMIADIRQRNDHISAGDIGFRFVIEAIMQAGRSDVIADLLSRTDAPSYGAQLAAGATSLTEAWDANPNSSHNHMMLGHGELWFWQGLGGIRMDLSQQGPQRLVIDPAFVRQVDCCEVTHASALGDVEVRWERDGNDVRLSVTIPVDAIVCGKAYAAGEHDTIVVARATSP
jgi:alpha-L-rhamnosidase